MKDFQTSTRGEGRDSKLPIADTDGAEIRLRQAFRPMHSRQERLSSKILRHTTKSCRRTKFSPCTGVFTSNASSHDQSRVNAKRPRSFLALVSPVGLIVQPAHDRLS